MAVLAKSDAFGHAQLHSGVVLGGRLIKRLAVGQQVSLDELVPWIRQLTREGQPASLYRVQPDNHFHTEAAATAKLEVR